MKLTHKVFIGASATLMILSLAGCGSQNDATGGNTSSTKSSTPSEKVVSASSNKLARMNYKSGSNAWVAINHDRSTLNPKSWKNDHVIYSNLDRENRTSHGNTAWLDSQNVANDSLRVRQVIKPTGYHQKFVNNDAIINRGHEIAYSLSKGINQKGQFKPNDESGDQNNPKNLFTQTAFSNQKVQTIYESKVRNALRSGKRVVFQVTPVFQGRDLMAKGVHMQAVSTDGKLNFNVYLFNVQPGMRFNYATGRSSVDRAMQVPTPKNAPKFHDNNSNGATNGQQVVTTRPRRRHHHWVRDYVGYRVGRHLIRRHYAKKYGYTRPRLFHHHYHYRHW